MRNAPCTCTGSREPARRRRPPSSRVSVRSSLGTAGGWQSRSARRPPRSKRPGRPAPEPRPRQEPRSTCDASQTERRPSSEMSAICASVKTAALPPSRCWANPNPKRADRPSPDHRRPDQETPARARLCWCATSRRDPTPPSARWSGSPGATGELSSPWRSTPRASATRCRSTTPPPVSCELSSRVIRTTPPCSGARIPSISARCGRCRTRRRRMFRTSSWRGVDSTIPTPGTSSSTTPGSSLRPVGCI